MDEKTVLTTCQRAFEAVKLAATPSGFEVGKWWRDIQQENWRRIAGFTDVREALRFAQDGNRSGFDHRIGTGDQHRAIIIQRIRGIERSFPGFRLSEHRELHESPWSDPSTISHYEGIPYSNIFLTHLYYFLRTVLTAGPDRVRRVVEIGGGYGGLARIFRTACPGAQYVIVDLPESLFFAHLFLSLNFPDARIVHLSEPDLRGTEAADIVLVPVAHSSALRGTQADIVINTGSLQEMPTRTVQFWMNFIENELVTGYFYSFNYFLNDKRQYSETSFHEGNLMCPVLDNHWRCDYLRLNPDVITHDCNARNWLEVMLRRIPREERLQPEALAHSSRTLLDEARLLPRGGSDWLQNVWMALWYAPTPAVVDEFLEGLAEFRRGRGERNLVDHAEFGEEMLLKAHRSYALSRTGS